MYGPFFISSWLSFRNPSIRSQDCDDPGEADAPIDYCLVLRKWMDINPAFEFRCFVKNKELVGQCQMILYLNECISGAECS